MFHKNRKNLCFMAGLLALSMLAGCGGPADNLPETEPVPVTETAAETTEATEAKVTVPFEGLPQFTTRDGQVRFIWNLSSQPEILQVPVVAAEPRRLDNQQIQNLLKGFYGENPIYSIPVLETRTLTKEELQDRIDTADAYLNAEDDEKKLVMASGAFPEEVLRNTAERLNSQMAEAPDTVQEAVWDGTVPLIAPNNQLFQALQCFGWRQELPYRFQVTDIVMNGSIRYSLDFFQEDGGPRDLIVQLQAEDRSSRGSVTGEAASQAEKNVEELLGQMAGDRWMVTGSQAVRVTRRSGTREQIQVKLAAAQNGVPELPDALGDFHRARLSYQYGAEGAEPFGVGEGLAVLNGEGQLLQLSLQNPYGVLQFEEKTPELLDFAQLQQMAQEQLADYSGEDFRAVLGMADGELTAEISGAEFGLVRVPVRNRQDRFQLVPAVRFYGPFYGEGRTYTGHKGQTLITVSAVDGSLIG